MTVTYVTKQQQIEDAFNQLEEQRLFLLRNQWKKGSPLDPSSGRLAVAGCLLERVCHLPESVDDLINHFITVDNIYARRAIAWALMESGYEDIYLAYDSAFSNDALYSAITRVNDHQFTHAGEAIEVLERAASNLKTLLE